MSPHGKEGGLAAPPSSGEDPVWVQALPPVRRGREAWVGVFVVVATLATLTALFTLTDASMFRGRYVTHMRVPEASGIRRGDPVQMRGVNVGRVDGFQIESDGVLVQLEIEGEYTVPEDSRVELVSSGIMGGMTARVIPGTAEERAGRGDILVGRVAPGFLDAAEGVGSEAAVALERIQELLSPGTVHAVAASAEQLRALLNELTTVASEEREALAHLTASLRRSAEGIEGAAAGPELERIVERLDTLVAEAAETARSSSRAAESLEVVLRRLQRGEGTLGRLSVDPALYEALQQAAAGVAELAEDVRRDPKRYIDLRVF